MPLVVILAFIALILAVVHAATRARFPIWPAVFILGLIPIVVHYGPK